MGKDYSGKIENTISKLESKLEIAEDGNLSMNDLVTFLLKSKETPVERDVFLKELLSEKYDQSVVEKAIAESPAKAGLSPEELKQLASQVVKSSKADIAAAAALKDAKEQEETLDKVKGLIKTFKENRTIRELLRSTQRILYIYGFPEIGMSEKGNISHAKTRLVMLMSLAAMSGTEKSDEALKAIAGQIDELPENSSIMQNLDKEEIGEILKKWRKKFIAAAAAMKAAKSNKLLGKLASKGATELNFEKYCSNLIDVLSDTVLSNPEHIASDAENAFAEMIKKASLLKQEQESEIADTENE